VSALQRPGSGGCAVGRGEGACDRGLPRRDVAALWPLLRHPAHVPGQCLWHALFRCQAQGFEGVYHMQVSLELVADLNTCRAALWVLLLARVNRCWVLQAATTAAPG